ncbi:hypothetical protein J437_LFUL018064 [Ladona fulva]|uniref:Uncharacterized protein n=1 Tax=Ladona fulva TaxID=123851 RepID=A0A8K0P7P3_LADFU|nr:hypothetical protein J437_LFUL018064 [Ladona fulva]
MNYMRGLKEFNDGYAYTLTVINIFSKCKTSQEITNALSYTPKTSKRKLLKTHSDKRKEYVIMFFKKFLTNHGIKFYHTNDPVMTCILRLRLWKDLIERLKLKCINTSLPLTHIIINYNQSVTIQFIQVLVLHLLMYQKLLLLK